LGPSNKSLREISMVAIRAVFNGVELKLLCLKFISEDGHHFYKEFSDTQILFSGNKLWTPEIRARARFPWLPDEPFWGS
jgi:hypothetical protein